MYTNIIFVLPNANLPTGRLPFQPIVSEVLFFQCHTETLNLPLGDAGTICLHAHPPLSLPMLRTHHQSLPMMLCTPVHPTDAPKNSPSNSTHFTRSLLLVPPLLFTIQHTGSPMIPRTFRFLCAQGSNSASLFHPTILIFHSHTIPS